MGCAQPRGPPVGSRVPSEFNSILPWRRECDAEAHGRDTAFVLVFLMFFRVLQQVSKACRVRGRFLRVGPTRALGTASQAQLA